jgi:hypothetical protein
MSSAWVEAHIARYGPKGLQQCEGKGPSCGPVIETLSEKDTRTAFIPLCSGTV